MFDRLRVKIAEWIHPGHTALLAKYERTLLHALDTIARRLRESRSDDLLDVLNDIAELQAQQLVYSKQIVEVLTSHSAERFVLRDSVSVSQRQTETPPTVLADQYLELADRLTDTILECIVFLIDNPQFKSMSSRKVAAAIKDDEGWSKATVHRAQQILRDFSEETLQYFLPN